MVHLFDTNAVISFLEGKGQFPALSLSDEVTISSITRLELLSGLRAEDAEVQAKTFLDQVRER